MHGNGQSTQLSTGEHDNRTRRATKLHAGFSLIELLIVVAIIGIIAAIAIPNFVRSRQAANEASAIQGVRTICSAQAAFYSTAGYGVYGSMAALKSTALLDPLLTEADVPSRARNGYVFGITNPSPTNYVLGSAPATARTGNFNFTSDASGIIYSAPGTPAAIPTVTGGSPIGN